MQTNYGNDLKFRHKPRGETHVVKETEPSLWKLTDETCFTKETPHVSYEETRKGNVSIRVVVSSFVSTTYYE